MSLHYILDGYNVLHKLPILESQDLQQQRKGLIRFLQERRFQGSINNDLTIVFDGQPEYFSPGGMNGNIRVIFSDGENADEKIKKMVADAGSKGHIVVVTDDRGIRLSVRASGAKVLSVQQFLSLRPSLSGSESKGKTIAPEIQAQIDEELRNIWLKKK